LLISEPRPYANSSHSLPRRPNQACHDPFLERPVDSAALAFDRMIHRAMVPPSAMRSYCGAGRRRAIGTPMALLYSPTARQARWQAARSGNERNALLLLRFVRGARGSGQLQHGRVLTFREPGKQHDLPVGELQRVVMHVWLLHLDLPESSYLLPDEFLATDELKNTLAFDFRLECDLRAGKKTHSYTP